MCATALKKAARSPECAAAACIFKQLAVLFASPSTNNNLRLETKQLDELMTAFKQAPVEEVAAVSQILKEILAFLSHLDENSVSTNKARARVKVKPAVAPEKAAKTSVRCVRAAKLMPTAARTNVRREVTAATPSEFRKTQGAFMN